MKSERRVLLCGILTVAAVAIASCESPQQGNAPKQASAPELKQAAGTRAGSVDPAATKILQRMTRYVGSLNQFSAHTQVTLEDLLESGDRADFDVSAHVTVRRPNKLRAERRGELIDQAFYYDGKTLTLFNPADRVYSTVRAPGTIEETLDYVRESLGLIVPVADLVYRNNFGLLMQDVSFAVVVGKSVIGGVKCDHLLFRRPGVTFQVWVAESGDPLPLKYVVTDTGTPARLSITTVMSDWDTEPDAPDDLFAFEPPEGAQAITFLPLRTTKPTGENQ